VADDRPARPDAHETHDPEIVAALLDREPSGAEHDMAARRVASCPECAALLADLRLLASATAALPVPARARDFRLTAADAAALREPVTAASRQTGEMLDTRDHATHDTLLVAGLADRTVAGPDRERAEALVAGCRLCAELRDDLVAIRGATLTLPTTPRTHDYRLGPEDAARLRPRGWRRLVAAVGSSRDIVTRPLAIGLTTLGLAGLLVATVPSVLTGTVALAPSAGATPQPASGAAAAVPAQAAGRSQATSPESAQSPAASEAPVDVRAGAVAPSAAATPAPLFDVNRSPAGATLEPAPAGTGQASPADGVVKGTAASPAAAAGADSNALPAPTDQPAQGGTLESARDGDAGAPSALVVVAGGLLAAGLGLFALRRVARSRVG
jgi:hypothetical protein